jgi:hypothetical protein
MPTWTTIDRVVESEEEVAGWGDAAWGDDAWGSPESGRWVKLDSATSNTWTKI